MVTMWSRGARTRIRWTIALAALLLTAWIFVVYLHDYNGKQRPPSPPPHLAATAPPGDIPARSRSQTSEDKEELGVPIARIKLKKVKGDPVVPWVIHYLLDTSRGEMNFTQILCIKSALEVITPHQVYLHNVSSEWEVRRVWPARYLHYFTKISHLFSYRPLAAVHRRQHSDQDRVKLEVLNQYGGIYLDLDMLVINPLPDELRYYELTVSWPLRSAISNKVILSAPHAHVINALVSSDKPISSTLTRMMESGELTSGRGLGRNRFHRVTFKLGTDPSLFHDLHLDNVDYIRNYYMVSLNQNKLYTYMERGKVRRYNEENIGDLNTTFGQLARVIWRK